MTNATTTSPRARVFFPDHGRVRDAGCSADHLLDLARARLLAGDDDQIFLPAGDVQKSVGIDVPQIAAS